MKQSLPLMVFTDLDGTLLDHDTYSWDAANEALDKLRQIGAAVVLASSKTAAEIIPLRQAIGCAKWPAIVENGAGLLPAGITDAPRGADYTGLRDMLARLPAELRSNFRGFGDMTAEDVSKTTGLSAGAAVLAKQRAFSEPGLWSGDPDQRQNFIDALAERGISAREGGRFLTLSFGQTKADQMAQIIAQHCPAHTIALGDAPNDTEMLQTADFGVIVANPHRAPLPHIRGENDGRITRTKLPGPMGWNSAVLTVVQRLGL